MRRTRSVFKTFRGGKQLATRKKAALLSSGDELLLTSIGNNWRRNESPLKLAGVRAEMAMFIQSLNSGLCSKIASSSQEASSGHPTTDRNPLLSALNLEPLSTIAAPKSFKLISDSAIR